MSESQWYKDAVIYELRVRSFFDSNADGVGDLVGLTQKLDYLQDLGVSALWLLPLYPSPYKDDGYDIADYLSVHPSIGKLDDFRELLAQAHRRGLKVITELVLNHTSDQHPWFQRARPRAAGSATFTFGPTIRSRRRRCRSSKPASYTALLRRCPRTAWRSASSSVRATSAHCEAP